MRPIPAIAGTGQVAREGVVPNVHHLRRIIRHREAPSAGASERSRHREIGQTFFERGERFLARTCRMDCKLAGADPLADRIDVPRPAKEDVLFLDALGRRTMLRTTTVDEIALSQKRLAADAIQTAVGAAIEV